MTDQSKNLIKFDSDTECLNKDIEQENQTNVDNAQVGQDSGFNELPFSEHGESDDIEVVSVDDAHVEPDNDDKNISVEQISEAYNEIKVDQVSTVQSPVSTEADYATPLERSESSNTKTINNDNSVRQEDDTDNDTDERELEDSLEPKGEERTLEEGDELIQSRINKDKVENVSLKSQNTYDEDLSADDINKSDKEEENEHEVEKNIKAQSRKESLSDGESLIDSTPDSSTPHTKTSRMSKDSSILSDHNSPKKKVSKSLFTNFSKGEKALLLFVALSSAAFIASFISSVLGKPLCPDKKGNLISLAILGTVAAITVVFSFAHFCHSDKSKEESLPLNTFGDSEVVQVLEDKKNR